MFYKNDVNESTWINTQLDERSYDTAPNTNNTSGKVFVVGLLTKKKADIEKINAELLEQRVYV